MHKYVFAATAFVALSAASIVGAAPAHASSTIHITSVDVGSLRVHADGCRYIPYEIQTDADSDDVTTVSMSIDVTLNGKPADTINYFGSDDDVSDMTGNWLWCPYLDGPGIFKLGEAQLEWTDADYNEHTKIVHLDTEIDARQDVKVSLKHSVSRNGRTAISGLVRFYSVGDGWLSANRPVTVTLQSSNNGKTWHNVAHTRTVRSSGKYSLSAKLKHGYRYRTITASTKMSWNGISTIYRR